MSHQKIDRKELKHDGLVDAVSQFSAHLHRHSRAYAVLAGACVLAAILIGYSVYRDRADQIQLLDELAAASNIEKLTKFYDQNQDSPEASVALLRLAGELYRNQDYSSSLQKYRRFVSVYPAGELVDLAGMGVAYSLEAAGNYEEAYREYASFPTRYQNSAFVPESIYNSARCLLRLNRSPEAARAYQEVISRYPRSIFAGLAQERLASLSGLNGEG